jgi:predicted metal-dependent HD superfamily phosphohydrolase
MAFEFISRPEPEQIYRALKDVIDAVLTGNAHYRELVDEVVRLEAELIQRAGKDSFGPYERKVRDMQALAMEIMFRAGFIFGRNLTSLEKELDQLKKAR